MKKLSTLSAALLVSGTTIGAGLLALPISTAASGFTFSALALFLVWAVMLQASLYFLEVASCFPPGVNLVTLAQSTLGAWGKWSAWSVYLLLLYALNAAYLSGLATMMQQALEQGLHVSLPIWLAAMAMAALLLWVLLGGIGWVDRLNRWLMAGLLCTTLVVLGMLAPKVDPTLWAQTGDVATLPASCLIMLTSFGFSIIVPSLREYMGFARGAHLPRAIVMGSGLALLLYWLWEGFILGIVPMGGGDGLRALLVHGQPSVGLALTLTHLLQQPMFMGLFMVFSSLLVLTSFIGVSLSLFDFLADGLHLKKQGLSRGLSCVLTLLPPLAFTLFYPQGFILALNYAGILVAFLLVFLPALLVFKTRSNKTYTPLYQAPGGMLLVWGVMVVALIAIGMQVL